MSLPEATTLIVEEHEHNKEQNKGKTIPNPISEAVLLQKLFG
jgi:hypothetical protein